MRTHDRGGTKASRLIPLLHVLTELSIYGGIPVGAIQRQLNRVGIVVSNRTVTRDLEMLSDQGIISYDLDNLVHVQFRLSPAETESEQHPPQKLISLTGKNNHREVFIDPSQVSSVITEGENGYTKISMRDRKTHLVIGEANEVAATINRERMRAEAQPA